jgi:hypothetical protein
MMEYLLINELETTRKAAVVAQFETNPATAAFCRKEGVKLRRALMKSLPSGWDLGPISPKQKQEHSRLRCSVSV